MRAAVYGTVDDIVQHVGYKLADRINEDRLSEVRINEEALYSDTKTS